jgi:hypothetical protein
LGIRDIYSVIAVRLERKQFCSFAKIEEFDVIITDDKISKELKDSIEKLHIEVI